MLNNMVGWGLAPACVAWDGRAKDANAAFSLHGWGQAPTLPLLTAGSDLASPIKTAIQVKKFGATNCILTSGGEM